MLGTAYLTYGCLITEKKGKKKKKAVTYLLFKINAQLFKCKVTHRPVVQNAISDELQQTRGDKPVGEFQFKYIGTCFFTAQFPLTCMYCWAPTYSSFLLHERTCFDKPFSHVLSLTLYNTCCNCVPRCCCEKMEL